MFVVTEVTGKVGAIVATTLLAANLPVRAVVRNEDKATEWRARGCDIAIVPDAADREALTAAFAAASAIFLMNPPNYGSEPGFPDSHAAAAATVHAIGKAPPGTLVLLSTIGAQASEFNLLNRSGIFEGSTSQCRHPSGFPKGRLVHGKCRLGRRYCARGTDQKLSSAYRSPD